ncbi:MAG: hypothetical protein Q4G70_03895 [Pseudomonadota bacterium]|nr:hypothetical protein [Pseudomonadota bacterium]
MRPAIFSRRRLRRCCGPALALLAAGCAQPPQAPVDRAERFADAYVQLLPLGRLMDHAAAQDPRWPLAEKAALVSDAQMGCMREALSSRSVTPRQRQTAREYAQTHTATLEADLQVLESGAARLIGNAMLAGAQGHATMADATPAEVDALAAFATEPRFSTLRQATGLDRMLGAHTRNATDARQRGRDAGHALLVKAMTDAFLRCHIPVKLLY